MPSPSPSPAASLATFSLRHNGTAAVYFTWQRRPVQPPPFASAATGGSGSGSPEQPSAFSLSRTSGVILPGESCDFTVAFSPPAPGLYSQEWTLTTQPPLPDWPPLGVAARGMCLPAEEPAEARRALEDSLAEAEKRRKVRGRRDMGRGGVGGVQSGLGQRKVRHFAVCVGAAGMGSW